MGGIVANSARPDIVGVEYVDSGGVRHGFIHTDGGPQVVAQDYLQSVAEGDISGHTSFRKFGFNGDIDNVEEDLWEPGGLYVWPAAPMQMTVKSTDNTNDKAGGAGMLKVKIYYLDNTWTERVEEVTLNGTTAVDTVATNIYRINGFRASDTGANKVAAGNITIADKATGAIVYAQISAGFTASRQLIYTVPLGKTLFITSVTVSAASATANQFSRTTLRTTYDEMAGALGDCFYPHAEFILRDFTIYRPFEMPEKCPEKTDIRISAIGNAANSNINMSAALRGWLE